MENKNNETLKNNDCVNEAFLFKNYIEFWNREHRAMMNKRTSLGKKRNFQDSKGTENE